MRTVMDDLKTVLKNKIAERTQRKENARPAAASLLERLKGLEGTCLYDTIIDGAIIHHRIAIQPMPYALGVKIRVVSETSPSCIPPVEEQFDLQLNLDKPLGNQVGELIEEGLDWLTGLRVPEFINGKISETPREHKEQ